MRKLSSGPYYGAFLWPCALSSFLLLMVSNRTIASDEWQKINKTVSRRKPERKTCEASSVSSLTSRFGFKEEALRWRAKMARWLRPGSLAPMAICRTSKLPAVMEPAKAHGHFGRMVSVHTVVGIHKHYLLSNCAIAYGQDLFEDRI